MHSKSIEEKFKGLWYRFINSRQSGDLTPELLEKWAGECGLTNQVATFQDVGVFNKTSSIVLTVDGGKACFPLVPASGDESWKARRKAHDEQAALWNKVEWFAPLWVPVGKINALLSSVKNVSKERAIDLFNYHTSTLYTVPFQAVCIEQIMPFARSLREIVPLAREAYLGAYSGYWAVSVGVLIPAIEGSLTRMVSGISIHSTIEQKIDYAINRAIITAARIHFDHMWIPREYLTCDYLFGEDERVFVFETFRRWLKSQFFCSTENYQGITWLNRHMFAHGSVSTWQEPANFARMIVALTTLAAIESWYDESHHVGLWLPAMNEASTLLWQQALLRADNQMKLKIAEQQLYHQHGRLVPEMPTDDGVLLRKAHLTQQCMNDLVRPLRDAGWNIRVNETDDKALYMTVEASDGRRRLKIALLYSCATDNDLYRELAEACEFILYLGAPYHQDQYAHGVSVHVGPVLGWQPPKTSGEDNPG
ncbi:hypothetical protein [Niveispirillum sp. BGYR6]|uniref:hypothetical protein n=1 Tax=Niveispirillum sp. BGYR6 TaxID=2971249 RepID=UPI0022B9CE68|nr:hypothetical protein [Niveispirillum sp. BGYR6]MDG5497923.1 hypothetical protein [Niveispirillum sp. BGYR6]